MLLVFGGLKGLEASLESDETLQESEVELLFDHYVNTCPQQGSRTIRTEVSNIKLLFQIFLHLDRYQSRFVFMATIKS